MRSTSHATLEDTQTPTHRALSHFFGKHLFFIRLATCVAHITPTPRPCVLHIREASDVPDISRRVTSQIVASEMKLSETDSRRLHQRLYGKHANTRTPHGWARTPSHASRRVHSSSQHRFTHHFLPPRARHHF
jgi:hypothetical protein